MAIDPDVIIANCEQALSDISSTGIVRYTMPDGRTVEKSVDEVLKIKAHFTRLKENKNSISPFVYGIPKRPS